MDLDDFKLVNDLGGHAAGDELLVRLAATWRLALPSREVLARVGGDEFALLLPGIEPDAANSVMKRLLELSPTGWSYGLAGERPGESLSDMFDRADRALYTAKASRAADGRNASTMGGGTSGAHETATPSPQQLRNAHDCHAGPRAPFS